ncbi:MAG: (Fe-S)-binding protein [Candidatus Gastranaerophilales bacterium]|nr:(Fe-S)-binding protein [Candidatus Gastranaerophilales bacterium]
MKKFQDYKDEIYTCSRCGLCQSVCPVFLATGKETTVSRGFFSTLMGVVKGHLKFNKKLRKNIDMCLTCNKCNAFCPSGIDASKIITAARAECMGYIPLWKKLILRVFYSKMFLHLSGYIRLYRFLPVLDFCKAGRILHEFLTPFVQYKPQKPLKKSNLRVVIFPGCINKYFNSSSLNAMKMLFEKQGIEYIIPDFECCTMPAYSAGDLEGFRDFALKNLKLIPSDIDYVIFDCASCKKAFALYPEFLQGDEKALAEGIFAKCKHINEFLVDFDFDLPNSDGSVAYHKPCHLDCFDETQELIKKSGLDLVPVQESCCGSGGLFFIENFTISNSLAQKRAQEITDANVDTVITDCPLCRLGLIKGGVLSDCNIKVRQLTELLIKPFK